MSRRRILFIAWGVAGVLALGLWLGLVATARSRAALLQQVLAADLSRLGVVEHAAAGDLLFIELGMPTPDPQAVAAAWTVLATGRDPERARDAIASRVQALIDRELSRRRPDQMRLRLAHDLAGVLGGGSAAAAHARIAAHAGQRDEPIVALAAAAADLRRNGKQASVERITTAWDGVLAAGSGPGGLTWASRETPPLSEALVAAATALRVRLDEQLVSPASGRRPGLLATWGCMEHLGIADDCPPDLVARYAATVRRDRVPASGLVVAVLVAGLLFGGAALAYRRLVRGVRPIDPGAETMEDVDAVDLDTDAVTVQRNTTGEETRVD